MKSTYKGTNANFKSAKILVVDDNDDQWAIMQGAMRQFLSEVMVQRVATINQAMTLLEEWYGQEWEVPKLILLDLYLPRSADGFQLLKQIKAMPKQYSRIPIVMLTSSDVSDDIEEAYQFGISAYMIKPTEFADWETLFQQLRAYWWETVTLPPVQYDFYMR
ncbi:response regulator [Spirosoma harenae]